MWITDHGLCVVSAYNFSRTRPLNSLDTMITSIETYESLETVINMNL